MKTIELFCGTKSFSKSASELGHTTFTVDRESWCGADLTVNIAELDYESLPCPADMLWASPPCTSFSVASIGHHWKIEEGVYTPQTEECAVGLFLLEKTISIIADLRPKMWFIENPRGMMRKIIDPIFARYMLASVRHTVTYCQYGDTRMKPTDIWTNCLWWNPKPACKNGSPCHTPAPRGSRTGTQGIKGNRDRSVVPAKLFEEIFGQCTHDS